MGARLCVRASRRQIAPILSSPPSANQRQAQATFAGYFALPVLHGDWLVGKVDATADRKASVLRVHASHEDVTFSRTMTTAVQAELEDAGLVARTECGPAGLGPSLGRDDLGQQLGHHGMDQ
jgi:hypothetical protein